jgi:hypothetical protein
MVTDVPTAALLADGENTHPVAVPTFVMSLAVNPEIAWLKDKPKESVFAVVGVDGELHVARAPYADIVVSDVRASPVYVPPAPPYSTR